jgi:hypothetical protein
MAQAKVTFTKVIQDSQELGSNDDYMASRVFFRFELSGEIYEGLYADLKQVVGAPYEAANIEVGPPQGYDGPWNAHGFQTAATKYFLECVGPNAHGIRIGPNASNIRMQNNTFNMEMTAEFEVPDN